MKKHRLNKVVILIILVAAILFVLLAVLLLRAQSYKEFTVFVLAVLIFGIGHYVYTIYRGWLVDKYYGELSALIGSLSLEKDQTRFTQSKHNRKLTELEKQISNLDATIKKKTTELGRRNNALKAQQFETLKKNRELSMANTALKESREKYNKLVGTLEEEYFLYTTNIYGEFNDVSPSLEKILGYSSEEFISRRSEIATPNPINEKAKEHFAKVKEGIAQEKFLLELYHKDCTTRMFEISELPVFDLSGKMISIEGIAHDITEAYNTEELIREQEEKYRQVFNSASDFIFLFSINKDGTPGKFLEANTYTLRFLGYTAEELNKISPDDLNAAEIWDGNHDREHGDKYERIWESKEGIIINVEISERTFTIKGRKVCIAVARDITERKKAVEEITFMNEELVNQKENLEALLDNLTQTQEQLVQSEKMAALGQLIAGVAHEINTPLGAIKASVGNLSDSLDSALLDLPELFKNQSETNLQLFLLIFKISRAKKTDLTSREKREKKRKTRKFLIEAGVNDAEIIADLLTYLEVYDNYEPHIELLNKPETIKVLRNARDFISLLKNTKTISIASEKAAKVVFALKKYAHRDALGERIPTDIVDGIDTVLTLYDNQLKQGIGVVKKYNELPSIMCYADEINQVWTNLIHNAIQAMGSSGVLTIETQCDEKNILVSIRDTGGGIDASILEKIFEPFYTTKKQGEGSGLGLDIVKKIIDKHSGTIDVESEVGVGSNFIITLPII